MKFTIRFALALALFFAGANYATVVEAAQGAPPTLQARPIWEVQSVWPGRCDRRYTFQHVLDTLKNKHGFEYEVAPGTDPELLNKAFECGIKPQQLRGVITTMFALLGDNAPELDFKGRVLTITGHPAPPAVEPAQPAPTTEPAAPVEEVEEAPAVSPADMDDAAIVANIRKLAAEQKDPNIKRHMLESADLLEEASATRKALETTRRNLEESTREMVAINRAAVEARRNNPPIRTGERTEIPDRDPRYDTYMTTPVPVEHAGPIMGPNPVVPGPAIQYGPRQEDIPLYRRKPYRMGDPAVFYVTNEPATPRGAGRYVYPNEPYGCNQSGYGYTPGCMPGYSYGYSGYGRRSNPTKYAREVRRFNEEEDIAAFKLRGSDRFLCRVKVYKDRAFLEAGCKINQRGDAKAPATAKLDSVIAFVTVLDGVDACFSETISPESMATHLTVNEEDESHFTIPVNEDSFYRGGKKGPNGTKNPLNGVWNRTTNQCDPLPTPAAPASTPAK